MFITGPFPQSTGVFTQDFRDQASPQGWPSVSFHSSWHPQWRGVTPPWLISEGPGFREGYKLLCNFCVLIIKP